MTENRTQSAWRSLATCGKARAGILRLRRGEIRTPVFMPVGTLGVVRGAVMPDDIHQLGYNLILGNTFHLWQRPGLDSLTAHGGLHGFSGWHHSILTDSGGFQVFSLAKLRKISEEGITFRAPHDGKRCFLSPERCMEIQRTLNSDIAMILDDCTPATADEAAVSAAMRRSLRWAQRCKTAFHAAPNLLFGIVQGGIYPVLRRASAAELLRIGFDGYAIGGLAVGEDKASRHAILADSHDWLPADKPRYLMGVGTPADIALAVADGIDMFDCVLPTRNARNGQLFTAAGLVRIRNACHRHATEPIEATCHCPVCRRFSRAYLHHLFRIGDMAAARLATLHNLAYYRRLMAQLGDAIHNQTLPRLVQTIVSAYA